MDPTPEQPLDAIRALAHPLRLRLLSLATGRPVTAAEAARELGGTQANASYHLRRLHAAGWLVVVERRSVRGGRSVSYRHTGPPASGSTRWGASGSDLLEVLAHELRRRATERDATAREHLTDAELWVSEEAWETFRAAVSAASTDLHRAAKAPRTPGTIRTSSTVALFRLRRPLGPRGAR